ncbi:glutamate receptor ionotropic, kainate 2-like isoform X2 [Brevipalpus obovatus]|uniref:glutamate receptor ionotropic, kainate 2-like isoform X2 n=1 Tax=Brevipalpus obovatus TaxID=246614 RepID=UPI003D9ECA9E
MLSKGFLFNSFVILFTSNLHSLSSVPNVIKIGSIFEREDDHLESAFKNAVERINKDRKILPRIRLEPLVERIEPRDSFQAAKNVCGLFEQGVAGIIGPQSKDASTFVQSTCDFFHVPHFRMQLDFRQAASNYSLNLYPPVQLLGTAIRSLIMNKGWKKFAVIYQEDEALLRLEEILKDPELKKRQITVRQFESDEYRIVFKNLHKRKIRNLVVDVPQEIIYEVLRHAKSVNMLSEYHDYIFSTYDLHNIDLDEFIEAGTNITAFSLIDRFNNDYQDIMKENQGTSVAHQIWLSNEHVTPEQMVLQNLTTEVALIYDSVKLLAKALHELDRKSSIKVAPLSCSRDEPWPFGVTLLNQMKNMKMNGITGNIRFDSNNQRENVRLDIFQLEYEGLKLVGNWTKDLDITFMSNYSEAISEQARKTLGNKTLVVVSALGDPYMMRKQDPECQAKNASLLSNECLEGFCVDILMNLTYSLKWKYEIHIVAGNAYGSVNQQGEWNGMIRELIDGKSDIAIADLTINHERERVVDFTHPFMSLGIGILFKKPKKESPSLFSFMAPLAIEVWVYLLTAFLGITLFQFVVARFSPYEWMNPHPCIRNPEELENNFTIKNTLWFTIGCLMQQGCYIMPRALSTRVLAASWWFFILILVSSYTANLAAFLTTERMANPIESVEDLAKQTKIHYGCLATGSTKKFFQNSTATTHARMWSFMESARPSVFVETNMKGVERVKKGGYAYLMESTSIEYTIERECDLYQVGSTLDTKGYGIATQPNSPYRKEISETITKLQEEGYLYRFKEKWWSENRCPKDGAQKVAGAASELGLANVGGVFVVLAIGSLISVFMAVGEFCWKMKQIPRAERDHIFLELMRELKNVTCCYGRARPVRRIAMDESGQVIVTERDDGNYPPMNILRYGYPHPLHPIPGGGLNDFTPNFASKDGQFLWKRRPDN